MKKYLLTLIMIIACGAVTNALHAQCTATNTAFKSGETLTYDLFYNWKFVWAKAGTATMSIYQSFYKGDSVYKCHLISRGSKQADRFFVMRDTLTSIVSTSMAPLYYRKGALEGDRYKVDEVWYSYPDGNSHIRQRYRNSKGRVTEQKKTSKACIYDMLSMLLRARSFDGSSFTKGQRLKFWMADGDDVQEQTLVYRGKETFKMDKTNVKYRCLVFSFVELKNGKEKDVITFYVTDDANHLPVRLDMNLSFGTAKAFLTGAKGVRNRQTAKVQ